MPESLLEAARHTVKLAKNAGAQGSFAWANRSRSVSIKVRDGKLEKVQESTDSGLSVSVYVDGRYSVHRTNDLRSDTIETFVKQAVELSRALEVDEFRQLPDPELYARGAAKLDLFDPAVRDVDVERRLDECMALSSRFAGKDRVISASSTVWDGHGTTCGVSSNGFEGSYETTSTGLWANATVRDEGDKRPEGGFGMNARHRSELASTAEIGDEALRRAQLRLGSRKGPTTRTTMVVDRRSASNLISRLLGPARGGAIQQGRSMWKDKLGKPAVSPKLTVVNDPLVPRAVGSRPFDREGIGAFSMPLIDGGALENYFIDTYYARKLEMKPTTGSWGNIVVEPGTRELDAIVADLQDGIYVTSWLGGNADSTTGDFSFGVRGHLIEKGKVGAPVGELNVTGNLLDLFKHLEEVGSDVWSYSMVRTPTLVFGNVQFSGA